MSMIRFRDSLSVYPTLYTDQLVDEKLLLRCMVCNDVCQELAKFSHGELICVFCFLELASSSNPEKFGSWSCPWNPSSTCESFMKRATTVSAESISKNLVYCRHRKYGCTFKDTLAKYVDHERRCFQCEYCLKIISRCDLVNTHFQQCSKMSCHKKVEAIKNVVYELGDSAANQLNVIYEAVKDIQDNVKHLKTDILKTQQIVLASNSDMNSSIRNTKMSVEKLTTEVANGTEAATSCTSSKDAPFDPKSIVRITRFSERIETARQGNTVTLDKAVNTDMFKIACYDLDQVLSWIFPVNGCLKLVICMDFNIPIKSSNRFKSYARAVLLNKDPTKNKISKVPIKTVDGEYDLVYLVENIENLSTEGFVWDDDVVAVQFLEGVIYEL